MVYCKIILYCLFIFYITREENFYGVEPVTIHKSYRHPQLLSRGRFSVGGYVSSGIVTDPTDFH